jgi:CheY-like chemotaxis protein
MRAPKALSIDGSRLVQLLYRSVLGGFEWVHARDAVDALELLPRHPDLRVVLLELKLAGLSGMNLLELLKRDARTAHLPVIIVTSQGGEAERQRALDAGAAAFVTKPFRVMHLMDVLYTAVGPLPSHEAAHGFAMASGMGAARMVLPMSER